MRRGLPLNATAKLGTQGLAQYLVYLVQEHLLPQELEEPLKAGAEEDWQQRGKKPVAWQDYDELWVRWFKQLIHGELDAVREQHDQAEDLEVFANATEAEETAHLAEAEAEAGRILEAVADEAEEVDREGYGAGS